MAVWPLLLLVAALAVGAPDWTDCPPPCRCKWSSGKKTAFCKGGSFSAPPDNLDSEMQVLDLSNNAISRLEADAFKSAGLINLQKIFIRESGLRDVSGDAFQELIILIEVDLSDNEISSLEPGTFHGNQRLRVLILSGNPIARLASKQFPSLPHLKSLELEGCRLELVHRDAFVNLHALESLNLKGNRLKNISEEVFMNVAHLKTLSLDGNPWRCDCDLRGFRDWYLASNLRSMSLACAEPERYRGEPWEDVQSADFACPPRVFLTPFPQVQAEAGGNVTFGCRVVGDPEPQVTWMYEGRPMNHTWATVEAEEGLLDKWANVSVSNVSDVDAGLYSCVAKNSLQTVSGNVSLVLPEIVTATTLSKSETRAMWWMAACGGGVVAVLAAVIAAAAACANSKTRARRRNMKASVSFTEQEKKLLDVSIATTTDRGTGSCEALGPDLELIEPPPVHITIESDPLPLAVFPPPPEFSTSALPAGAFGNIFISVSVSRDPGGGDASRCPDLLDLPHRTKKPAYHGTATLPRRPCFGPHYDNMGPRVTAGGSSTLSLPDSALEAPPPPPPPPPPPAACQPLAPDFVSL